MKKGYIHAFTLIELLVVISIIGVLMGLLLVAFQGSRKTARDGKRQADLEQIRAGLEMCRNDKGSYPTVLPSGGGVDCSAYLPIVPPDPLNPTYAYQYQRDATNTSKYYLCAHLENGATSPCSGPVSDCGAGGVCGSGACNYKVCNP